MSFQFTKQSNNNKKQSTANTTSTKVVDDQEGEDQLQHGDEDEEEEQQHDDEEQEDHEEEQEDHEEQDDDDNDESKGESKQETKTNSVFVGNLDFKATAEDLKQAFSEVGEVADAHIFITNFGKSKGSGLVTFVKPEDASKATKHFVNKQILGRPVFVREDRAQPGAKGMMGIPSGTRPLPARLLANKIRIETPVECQVFVGNLPFTTSWRDLKELCAQHGNVVRADILKDSFYRSKGSGTVVFASENDAANAVAKLNQFNYHGRALVVHLDTHAGCKLFVGNIPFSMSWQDLKTLFSTYGNVIRADVERLKGYGTVSFSSRKEADAAIAALNGKKHENRVLIVRHDSKAYAI